MTISSLSSEVTVAGNGSQTVFSFNFVGAAASDITVSSAASNGVITPLLTSQYTVSLNAAATNQLWGIGGSITTTTAPATGTSLIIQRILPLTQSISVQNQGNYYSQVTEQALDTLCMEIQQVAARTTQFRGIWTTSTAYNVGDIVQDGANGAGTQNYYICQVANTSGVWATDLSNGDWAISVLATVPTTNQPITLSGAVSGNGTTSIITGLTYSMAPNSVLCNPSATSAIQSSISLSSSSLLGRGSSGNVADISLGSNLSMTGNVLSANLLGITSSITTDVSLNNQSNFFDGPTIAQGTVGTWFASGSVTVLDTSGAADFLFKLWDGTTVIASGQSNTVGTNQPTTVTLSGYLSSPAGNLRISVLDASSTSGKIKASNTGLGKDSEQ